MWGGCSWFLEPLRTSVRKRFFVPSHRSRDLEQNLDQLWRDTPQECGIVAGRLSSFEVFIFIAVHCTSHSCKLCVNGYIVWRSVERNQLLSGHLYYVFNVKPCRIKCQFLELRYFLGKLCLFFISFCAECKTCTDNLFIFVGITDS